MTHINSIRGATYSPAVVAGGLNFTAGQVGEDPKTGAVPADFEAEVRVALDNLETLLADAGSDLSRVVKASCYIDDLALVDIFNTVYRERIPEPRPARATVQVRMNAPYRIEIECVAAVGDV